MGVTKLLAALVALALLFAPSAALAGRNAAPGPDHQMQMMDGGHCQWMPASSDDHDEAAGKNCCASMCVGVAVSPSAPIGDRSVPRVAATFIAPGSLSGLPSELATPPPRLA